MQSILHSLDGVAALAGAMKLQVPLLAGMMDRIIHCFQNGGKLMTCGNGGSAAEALHLAEELVGRFEQNRRPLPAMCLSADPTALTCIANDWEYAEVFARQVEAHGRPGDVLVALTTSGKSPSILRALQRARKQGVTTIGLLGPSGSAAQSHCDLAITFDGHPSARVQEGHLIAIHLFLERIDAAFPEDHQAA